MRSIVLTLSFGAAAYAGICALVFLWQDRLLFFPQPSNPQATARLAPWHRLVESSDATLSGWVIPAANPTRAPLVFYFGGNAEDVSVTGLELTERLEANLVLMNYRGYGKSSGAPSEDALFEDALRIYDSVLDTTPHNGKAVVFGRSLGTGVGIYLSAHRQVHALVLATPYDSIRSVAVSHYPWLPVSTLLRHPFDSLSRAALLNVPALFIVAGRDEIIPPAHARQLAESWGGPAQWVLIEGSTHNSVGEAREYWSSIARFLSEV